MQLPPIAMSPQTDAIGSVFFGCDAVPLEIPPEQRKVDPSTIWWPEGEPKPWEENSPPEPRS